MRRVAAELVPDGGEEQSHGSAADAQRQSTDHERHPQLGRQREADEAEARLARVKAEDDLGILGRGSKSDEADEPA